MKQIIFKDKAAILAAMAKGRKLFSTASEHTQNIAVSVLILAEKGTLMFEELNEFIKELPGAKSDALVEFFVRFGGFINDDKGFNGWQGKEFIRERFNGWTDSQGRSHKGPKETMWWTLGKQNAFKIDSLDNVIKAALSSWNTKAKKAKKLNMPVDGTISDELAKMLLRHSSLAGLLNEVDEPATTDATLADQVEQATKAA